MRLTRRQRRMTPPLTNRKRLELIGAGGGGAQGAQRPQRPQRGGTVAAARSGALDLDLVEVNSATPG